MRHSDSLPKCDSMAKGLKICLLHNCIMGLLSRKPSYCKICGAKLKHKNKPKREWGVKGPLCGDCYVTKTTEFYEAKIIQPCVVCGVRRRVADMWEPRWQWDMDGLLCKDCFEKKETGHKNEKSTCSHCGTKLGFIRYNPKPKWNMNGQLCRECWDNTKAELGWFQRVIVRYVQQAYS